MWIHRQTGLLKNSTEWIFDPSPSDAQTSSDSFEHTIQIFSNISKHLLRDHYGTKVYTTFFCSQNVLNVSDHECPSDVNRPMA